MTIQAGLTGPPLVPELRVRVWSDRPGTDVAVSHGADRGADPGRRRDSSADFRSAPCTRRFRRVVEISGIAPGHAGQRRDGRRGLHACSPRRRRCRAAAPDRLLLLPARRPRQAGLRVRQSARPGSTPRPDPRRRPALPRRGCRCPTAPTPFDRTHARYRQYWQEPGNARYLRGGPTLFTPDDHDFWNDYPYRMPHLTRSRDSQWMEHARAAQSLFDAYQGLGNPEGRSWFSLDLGLVSLFVLDTRSDGEPRRGIPPSASSTRRRARRCWSGARR